MKIAVVAGENSGDYLGGELLKALKERIQNPSFFGIGGQHMQAQGLNSLHEMQQITVMGLDDLAHRIVNILKIRKQLVSKIIQERPDVFIGIDVPDFNLGLERKLRTAGITVVHYVSPTVWAWRSYRIKKISRSVDLMLTLFPFEADYYRQHNVPAKFVGHPIMDELERLPDQISARKEIAVDDRKCVAILPGSRNSEVDRLAEIFLETACKLISSNHALQFILPAASPLLLDKLKTLVSSKFPDLPVKVVLGQSRECLVAADVALLASGTAALESALIGTPMVVAYKVSLITELMFRLFGKTRIYSMPNHLLDEPIIPEFVQGEVRVENLSREVARLLDDKKYRTTVKNKLVQLRKKLGKQASKRAANEIVSLTKRFATSV